MEVRPKWPDGTPAHTKKIFGVVDSYDLRKEFPIMTLRQCFYKSALDEIIWIYFKASNKLSELNSHVWDEWADEHGTIGKAYGYQVAKVTHYPEGYFDQMEKVIYDLKHTPMSRSIMTNLYCVEDLPEMALRPCAYGMTYNVTRNTETGEMILNGLLNQRSQDMLTANNWNTIQYAMLLMLVAKEVGMTPGIFTHVIADCHIYDRHVPIVEDMIKRAETAPNDFEEPKLVIADYDDFWKIDKNVVHLEGYQFDHTDYKIEVAI
jgi:thymidylate synthase